MIHPLVFYLLAALTVGCAVAVVSLKDVFHSGLFLIGAFLGVAGIYVSLDNYFLAAAQLLIYSGAIAVLMLFGIMMTQKSYRREEPTHNTLWLASLLLSGGFLAMLIPAGAAIGKVGFVHVAEDLVRGMGSALMQAYALPFEIVSVVLLAALIGVLAIAGATRTGAEADSPRNRAVGGGEGQR